MAEAILRQLLAARGVDGIEVISAGTGAWDGAPASESAYLVGLERGLDLSGHRAKLLNGELIATSALILTMARHHRARVLELDPSANVHLLGEFAGRSGAAAEVSDPFGADLDTYRRTRDQLAGMIESVADRLSTGAP